MKRTPLHRTTPSRYRARKGTYHMVARRIRAVSKKKAAQKVIEDKLTQWLLEFTDGTCEICHHGPGNFGLSKHEIIFRGRGGDATDPLNVLLLCQLCHNHVEYPVTGTPLSTDEQLEIARNRMEEHGEATGFRQG